MLGLHGGCSRRPMKTGKRIPTQPLAGANSSYEGQLRPTQRTGSLKDVESIPQWPMVLVRIVSLKAGHCPRRFAVQGTSRSVSPCP